MDIKQAIDRLERELTSLRYNLKSLPDEPLTPIVAEYYRGGIRHVEELFDDFAPPESRTSVEAFSAALDVDMDAENKERLCILLRRFMEAKELFLSKPVLSEDEPERETESTMQKQPEGENEESVPEEAVFADYYASMIAEIEANKAEAADKIRAEKKAKAEKRAQERRVRESRQRNARDETLRAEAQRRGIKLTDEQSISAYDLQAEEARRIQREQEKQRREEARRAQERAVMDAYNERMRRGNRVTGNTPFHLDFSRDSDHPIVPTESRRTDFTQQQATAAATAAAATATAYAENVDFASQSQRQSDNRYASDRREQEQRIQNRLLQRYQTDSAGSDVMPGQHSEQFYENYRQNYSNITGNAGNSASASGSKGSSQQQYPRESITRPITNYAGQVVGFAGSVAVGAVMGNINRYMSEGEGNPLPALQSAAHYASLGASAMQYVTTPNSVKQFSSNVAQAAAYQARHDGYKLSSQAMADRELLQQLKAANGGNLPTSRSCLQSASRVVITNSNAQISARYGRLAQMSDSKLQTEITLLNKKTESLKSEFRHLSAKGARRTAEDSTRLAAVQEELKKVKEKLTSCNELKTERDMLQYKQKRLMHMSKTVQKKMSFVHTAKSYPRRKLTSLMREGADSNTEGMAVVLDPRAQKLAVGAAKVPLKVTHAVAQNIAPAHKVVTAPSNLLKKGVNAAKREISHLVPQSIKHAVTSTRSAIYGAKLWAANTKLGRGVSAVRKGWQTVTKPFRAVGKFVSTAFGAVKAVLLKVLFFVVGFILICCVLSNVIFSSFSTSSVTTIMSPDTGTDDKIDLTAYCTVLRRAERNWEAAAQAALEAARSAMEAKDESEQGNITMESIGSNSIKENRKAILCMMAVRLQQDLDMDTNPDVQEYLEYMFDVTHTQNFTLVADGAPYKCETEDCDTKTETYTIESGYDDDGNLVLYNPPITGTREVSYCPGKHQDYRIEVNVVTSLDSMFSLDHWSGGDSSWEGWTEENKEWAQLIYDQDWDELYTGFNFTASGIVANISIPEYTDKIWDFLMDLIGNKYGVAGLMGNLYAESGLNPMNMENSFEGEYNDETYTAAVNSGEYTLSQFMYDQNGTDLGIGYGLAQWSSSGRKRHLYNLTVNRGLSIANIDAQLELLSQELQGSYSDTLDVLRNATSVREASDYVLINFEVASGRYTESKQEDRASYGEAFYNYEVYGIYASGDLTDAQLAVVYVATHWDSFNLPIKSGYCWKFAATVISAATGIQGGGGCAHCAMNAYANEAINYDLSKIPVGAALFTSGANNPGSSGTCGSKSYNHTYGHVGVYIGNGLVIDCNANSDGCILEDCCCDSNFSLVHIKTLEHWIEGCGDDLAWGWSANKDLSAEYANYVSVNITVK